MNSFNKISYLIIILIIFNNVILPNEKNNIDNKSQHSIYLELGGQSPFLSINFDNVIFNTPLSYRVGAGLIITPLSSYYTLPIGLNYSTGKINVLDIGVGVTPWLSMNDKIKDFGKNNNKLHPNIWIGYRYQNANNIFFKFGLAIYIKEISHYVVFPGISIGTSF